MMNECWGGRGAGGAGCGRFRVAARRTLDILYSAAPPISIGLSWALAAQLYAVTSP